MPGTGRIIIISITFIVAIIFIVFVIVIFPIVFIVIIIVIFIIFWRVRNLAITWRRADSSSITKIDYSLLTIRYKQRDSITIINAARERNIKYVAVLYFKFFTVNSIHFRSLIIWAIKSLD